MNWLTKKAHQQSILFRLILRTFITVIIYKDNFFQKYIRRCLKNTVNSSQKRWPSLVIKSYHNRGFRQVIIIIFLLSASVKGGITFSRSAKAFINFQETILKSICMLVTNCKQEHRMDLKRRACVWKIVWEDIRKLLLQRFHFHRSIMSKILQTIKMSKKKNNRWYSGLVLLK